MKPKKFKYNAWLLFFIWLGGSNYVYSQKNDYVWLNGGGSSVHNETTYDSMYGNIKLDFNYNPVQISFDSINMNFMTTDVSFSDSNGNLLFYSDGIYIANASDATVEHGDSINFGDVYYQWGIASSGNDIPQGIMALPSVANPNQYYLIHSFCDTMPGNSGENYITKILSTFVDMQANGGLGTVIYKNQPILANNVFNGALTATRHGNGRDWWIIIQKHGTNCFYSVLMDSTGFHVIDSVCTGPIIPLLAGQDRTCFSPDGSKFVYLGYLTGASLFDFDRCSGTLSNFNNLPVIPYAVDSGDGIGLGVSLSPNNRFLYVSTAYQLYQFDLLSDNILGNIDTVGILDSWYYIESDNRAYFSTMQLAPDGKIYMVANGSGIPVYNVINSPDSLGLACNFTQHSVNVHTVEYGLPNYPNYRLGALTQSQCDTLGLLSDIQRAAKEQIIKVYPNPAADYAIVDYGFTDWSKPQPNLEICNALGQMVYQQVLPIYSGLQKIDVSNFADGMYMVFVKRENAVIATSKLVKQ